MATSYNITNFTPDVVPEWAKKDVAHLVATAVGVGWTFLIKADNSATLVAPAPHQYQTIHLSSRRTSGPIRRLGMKVMKYADPNLLEQATAKPATPLEKDLGLVEEEAAVGTEAITLVRERPMVSIGGPGMTYESDIATQKEWSDGSITFHCRFCDFQGKTPRSMASHQKKHAPARQAPEKKSPCDSLAAALVKRMEAGLDWVDLHTAAHELAEVAMEWGVVRETAKAEPVKVDSEDTRILRQIRELLGVGNNEEENEELRKKVRTLTIQVEAERAEAEHLSETLTALRGLINEAAS